MVFLPRVEALRTSTLGYEIATPTELLLLADLNSSLMMRPPRVIHNLVVVGFAFLWLTVTPVGKRVFLRVVAAIPNPRLPGGRLKSRKYKKSAVGGKKSPAAPVQKNDYLIIYR